VRELLSPSAVRAAGIFDHTAVEMLVKKCLRSPAVGELDSMALVGVLSTQLLHNRFVQGSVGGAAEAALSASSLVLVDEQTHEQRGATRVATVS
jgi:asparagine synthase (glutamine-hydrolysing)